MISRTPTKYRAWTEDGYMYYSDDYTSLEEFFKHQKTFKCLMQFTGIYDRHDKPIYENDIVRYFEWKDNPYIYKVHRNLFEVTWMEDHAKFELYSPDELWPAEADTDKGLDTFVEIGNQEHMYEIIGNVYQNPEFDRVPDEPKKNKK
jgi:uncharacterized phage protein (TIGR01671 family)